MPENLVKSPVADSSVSRPFFHFYDDCYKNRQDKDYRKFSEALYELSVMVMDYQSSGDLDLFRQDGQIDLISDDALTIVLDCSSKKRLQSKLSSSACLAMDRIAECLSGIYNDKIDGSSFQNMCCDLEMIWNEVPLLDPRLSCAEEIFLKEGRAHGMTHGQSINSLKWMAREENAEKVASMFLYSRFAPYFGCVDPEIEDFVARVSKDIDRGFSGEVIEKLRNNPIDYFNGGEVDANLSVSGVSDDNEDLLEEHFPGAGNSLKNKAYGIVADYRVLRDGIWANAYINRVIRNNVLKAGNDVAHPDKGLS